MLISYVTENSLKNLSAPRMFAWWHLVRNPFSLHNTLSLNITETSSEKANAFVRKLYKLWHKNKKITPKYFIQHCNSEGRKQGKKIKSYYQEWLCVQGCLLHWKVKWAISSSPSVWNIYQTLEPDILYCPGWWEHVFEQKGHAQSCVLSV